MESLCDLRPGQEVKVEETGLRVRLVSVDEDSRCPVGVNCVWAGNVRIALSLSLEGSRDEQVSINSALDPRAVRLQGRRITIEKVAPPKIIDVKIKPDEYVITLAVTSEESDATGEREALDPG